MFDPSEIINDDISEDDHSLMFDQMNDDRVDESMSEKIGFCLCLYEPLLLDTTGLFNEFLVSYARIKRELSSIKTPFIMLSHNCVEASLPTERYCGPIFYRLMQYPCGDIQPDEDLVLESMFSCNYMLFEKFIIFWVEIYNQWSFSASLYRQTHYLLSIMMQLVRDIILYHLPTSTHSQKAMVSALAAQSSLLDHRKRKKMEEFCLKYKASSALDYYTEDSFFYRVINSILRQGHCDVIYQYRHAIINIIECLRRPLPSEDDCVSLTLYRGQLMSIFELEKLKNNIGSLLSCSSFFSTSFNKHLAKTYSGDGSHDDPCVASVIFRIHLNTGQSIRPYALINNSAEDEVLFSPGTKFVLMSCRKLHDNGRLWLLDLKAVSEEQHEQHKLSYGETFLLTRSASGKGRISVVVVQLLIT